MKEEEEKKDREGKEKAWIESENRRILHEVRGDILNFC